MPILAVEYMLGNYLLMSINKAKMKLSQRLKNHRSVLIFLLIGSIIMLLILAIHVFKRPHEKKCDFKIEMTEVIHPNDTIRASAKQIEEHNSQLREYLYHRISVAQTSRTTSNASVQQMRGFYIILLAGLLSIFFSSENARLQISVLSMCVIGIVFSLEVHQQDVNERNGRFVATELTKAVDTLINSSQDTVWYSFSYEPIKKALESKGECLKRLKRKLLKALKPKPDQFALYVLPFLFLVWRIRQINKKRSNDGRPTNH